MRYSGNVISNFSHCNGFFLSVRTQIKGCITGILYTFFGLLFVYNMEPTIIWILCKILSCLLQANFMHLYDFVIGVALLAKVLFRKLS